MKDDSVEVVKPDQPDPEAQARAAKIRAAREDAYWLTIADVDWEDLHFFLNKARITKDKESFDTAVRVLDALRHQVLTRKDNGKSKKSS